MSETEFVHEWKKQTVHDWIKTIESYDLRGHTAESMLRFLKRNKSLLENMRLFRRYSPAPPKSSVCSSWINMLVDQVSDYYPDMGNDSLRGFAWFICSWDDEIATIYKYDNLRARFKG